MEGEKPGQKEDGKGWVSVPSQAAPQEFLGIPFWKQLSIKQPLLGPGYQGPDSHSHLKLNPQLLLCTLSGVGLREEVAFRIQRSHRPRLHVEEQGPAGSRTVDKIKQVSGCSDLKSRRWRRHTLVFSPILRSSPALAWGLQGC